MTTAQRLPKAIGPLPFGARQRLLARTARDLAGSAGLDELLRDLDGRGEFERRVALHLAYVAGHRGHVEQCLSAGETAVVRQAIGAAIRLDLPAEAFLARLPTALRQILCNAVRRRSAGRWRGRLLPLVREAFGDHEAAGLLPMCSPATVAEVLPDLEHAVTNLGALGRRHPAVVFNFVTPNCPPPRRCGGRTCGTASPPPWSAPRPPNRVGCSTCSNGSCRTCRCRGSSTR